MARLPVGARPAFPFADGLEAAGPPRQRQDQFFFDPFVRVEDATGESHEARDAAVGLTLKTWRRLSARAKLTAGNRPPTVVRTSASSVFVLRTPERCPELLDGGRRVPGITN